ncbi:MAG: hypothetical protein D6812_03290 [Deltaproteobacteria bacterium]|nr:MAG: hypothetical protein D6812_03290 [Deltaproteobacteria bacterium]
MTTGIAGGITMPGNVLEMLLENCRREEAKWRREVEERLAELATCRAREDVSLRIALHAGGRDSFPAERRLREALDRLDEVRRDWNELSRLLAPPHAGRDVPLPADPIGGGDPLPKEGPIVGSTGGRGAIGGHRLDEVVR